MPARTGLAWLLVIALLTAAAARLFDGGKRTGGSIAASPGARLSARVVRVVDWDTVEVSIVGRRATVRYIGIATPESVKPNTPVQCYAKAASHRNEDLVGGRQVTLEVGAEPHDRY